MINEIDSLGCSIKIDYDIPFEFTEERELAFENIVNSLYRVFSNDKGIKILANYTTNTNIDIFKSTNSSISRECFKTTIQAVLGMISNAGVKVKTENSEDSYPVEFYVEFFNSDNFKIINNKNAYKDSTNNNTNIKDSTDNDKQDDNAGLVNVEVKFNAAVDKNFVEMFKSTIDHKIEYLIDLDTFPEIKHIFGATTKVL